MERRRNEIFQRLKPPCVNLSRCALSYKPNKAANQQLISSLTILFNTLNSITSSGQILDAKLADYVFFPLSHVFRQSKDIPEHAFELALLCLDVLLSKGWTENVADDLAKQLLILLTFTAGGNPTKEKASNSSEELKSAAFKCLSSLFRCYSSAARSLALTETSNVPALGHAVTVMLEGIRDGPSTDVQLAAISAVDAFQGCALDREALASFFPGTISNLARVLVPDTGSRRSWKVLVRALGILSRALKQVLNDANAAALTEEVQPPEREKPTPVYSSSWLKATSSQVKLALVNVFRLQTHTRPEVRNALLEMCLDILQHCRHAHSGSISMVVETMIGIAAPESAADLGDSEKSLRLLIDTDAVVSDSIKACLHNWAIALPRQMQSNDDKAKRTLIGQISSSFRLLSDSGTDSSMIADELAASLKNSISASIQVSPSDGVSVLETYDVIPSTALMISGSEIQGSREFGPVIMAHKSQTDTMAHLRRLLAQLALSASSSKITSNLIESLYGDTQLNVLSGLWLSVNILNNYPVLDTDEERFLSLPNEPQDTKAQLIEELYSFSSRILLSPDSADESDWRLKALAIEAVALQAEEQKEAFKPELVEILYPVIHLLGSTNAQLQQHAIICLNILARSCGYPSTKHLIVQNVDYLVNAIGLKLNTFDVSPQAPQVLLMMIKLSGSSLLPYLDDLVGSMFSALENFHGYPKLVELLFSALQGIVEEGAAADPLAITMGETHLKSAVKPKTIADVIAELKAYDDRLEKRNDPNRGDSEDNTRFPHRAFKDEDHVNAEASPQSGEDPPQSNTAVEATPIPPTKTYTLLLNIASLTQHYLTQPSAPLRLSLLHLLITAAPALSRSEDAFLPLVATLWPVLTARLYDDSAFVCVAAADAIGTICLCAGDFLSARVAAEWPAIQIMMTKTQRKILKTQQGRGRGPHTPEKRLWDASVKMVARIVQSVRISDEIVDEVIALIGREILQTPDLRDALDRVAPDALWLAGFRWEREDGGDPLRGREVPEVEGFEFCQVGI
ncbi:MAG: hypothetical protein M1825_002074 [Sarcosagium campestre]|nr:MAG: hypothetical protein M1825_002074 [Sarcosagium campestre]